MSLDFHIGQLLGDVRAKVDGLDRKVVTICKAQAADRKGTSELDKRVETLEDRFRLLVAGIAVVLSLAANVINNDGLLLLKELAEHLKP